jgi:hypothetical protein
VIVALIVYLAGAATTFLGRFINNRRFLGKKWKFGKQGFGILTELLPREPITISVAVTEPPHRTEDYTRPGTGIGEVQSYAFINESLTTVCGDKVKVELHYSGRFPQDSSEAT